ncbi:MAG TPA: tRNA pseudouridine(38-40) synthase TruA [Syntrophales bacterium]|nr:tRNA pseudouridine(38-40) synthase TruA [Syntrophales bacterium]HQB29229.1 tRNA pseudouridine(38-40) synthase TruA [Syntrophales bacterium]HQN77446.1 tRNA pseudouridine(38-40) synthase TruA [Syntrophales bacterium]HQQ27664.1 tRNA pseudouridine(38-40) synthase TruA [Syntrophales bacterium]
MNKYRLTIEYDGTNYRGWQTQQNARSVQGTVLQAAVRALGEVGELQGAGRTDAGVHALGQVAHLVTEKAWDPGKIRDRINGALPSGIHVLDVEKAPERFHARHHALSRSYVYILSKERTAFAKRFVWWVRDPLDREAMEEAIRLFRGFHDFASFCDRRFEKGRSTLVEVSKAEMETVGRLVFFRFAGSHFLWKMVRRMVGVLVEVGRGTLKPRDVERMLAEPSDVPAKHTAPPSGLFLHQVLYEGDSLKPFPLPLACLSAAAATDGGE